MSIVPEYDKQNVMQGVTLFGHDITSVKKYENEKGRSHFIIKIPVEK